MLQNCYYVCVCGHFWISDTKGFFSLMNPIWLIWFYSWIIFIWTLFLNSFTFYVGIFNIVLEQYTDETTSGFFGYTVAYDDATGAIYWSEMNSIHVVYPNTTIKQVLNSTEQSIRGLLVLSETCMRYNIVYNFTTSIPVCKIFCWLWTGICPLGYFLSVQS